MTGLVEGGMLASVVAGLTLGLSVALPFGPVSLVCVQRSIAGGCRPGLLTGAGAASAHGVFAAAALAGRSAIAPELIVWSEPLRWTSAALLLWLGLRTLMRRSRPATAAQADPRAIYASSMALALSNPMTVLPYLAVASAGATAAFSSWSVLGVVAGAAAWYGLLSGGASLFRAGLPDGFHRPLNLVAGSMLMGFGVWVGIR